MKTIVLFVILTLVLVSCGQPVDNAREGGTSLNSAQAIVHSCYIEYTNGARICQQFTVIQNTGEDLQAMCQGATSDSNISTAQFLANGTCNPQNRIPDGYCHLSVGSVGNALDIFFYTPGYDLYAAEQHCSMSAENGENFVWLDSGSTYVGSTAKKKTSRAPASAAPGNFKQSTKTYFKPFPFKKSKKK